MIYEGVYASVPFYWHELKLIQAWTSNNIHYNARNDLV